ncbi:uncharacterized protein [Antedon mediterranea]|uniref:uncharacterized protein isoform X2 n=1 Tax=Antedon mediterranea TaxID=105859 RepID=UPI003AF7D8E6
MPTSLQQRLNNSEYKNWIKSGQALNLLNESLKPFSEQKITQFHDQLKADKMHLGQCKSCKPKKEPPDNCKICNAWKTDIFEKHSNRKMTYWSNVDPKDWPINKWEVAKTYMPRGQKPGGAYEPDISAILNLMHTCKIFQPDVAKTRIEKVISVRNSIMHSTDMKVSHDKLKEYLDTILKMFDRLVNLPNAASEQVRLNMQNVTELDTFEFKVCSEAVDSADSKGATSSEFELLEIDLISQRFKALEQKFDSIEDQLSTQNKEDLKESLNEFFNQNPDLKHIFNNDLTEIFENRLQGVEGQVSELDSRLQNLEKKSSKGQGNTGQQKMYKNFLQDYCIKNKLPLPVYEEFVYDHKELPDTSSTSLPHQPGKKETTKKEESTAAKTNDSERDTFLKGKSAVQCLKEYCDKNSNYYKSVNYTDEKVANERFFATVTIQFVNGAHTFEGEISTSKKSAKQHAAWKAIQEIIIQKDYPSSIESTRSVPEASLSDKKAVTSDLVVPSSSIKSPAESMPANMGLENSSIISAKPVTSDEYSSAHTSTVAVCTEPMIAGILLKNSSTKSGATVPPSGEPGQFSTTKPDNVEMQPNEKLDSKTTRNVAVLGKFSSESSMIAGIVLENSITKSGATVPPSGEPVQFSTTKPDNVEMQSNEKLEESKPRDSSNSETTRNVAVPGKFSSESNKELSSSGKPKELKAVLSSTDPVTAKADAPENQEITILKEVDTIYKNKLQEHLQKQGETSIIPDYSKMEETKHNSTKCFRGVVEFNYRFQFTSNETSNTKKKAEMLAAKEVLSELDITDYSESNTKGRLLEVFPHKAVQFVVEDNNDGATKTFSCIVFLNVPLKVDTSKLAAKKKHAEQQAAKEAFEKIQDKTLFNRKYFNFKK